MLCLKIPICSNDIEINITWTIIYGGKYTKKPTEYYIHVENKIGTYYCVSLLYKR